MTTASNSSGCNPARTTAAPIATPIKVLANVSLRRRLSYDLLGDAVANGLVDLSPIFERACQYRLGHAVLEVAHDIGYQPVTLCIVHDLSHQGAGLPEIIVLLALRIGGVNELSACLPHLDLRKLDRIGLWSALGIGRIYWVRYVLDAHQSVLAVAAHGHLRSIDRDLLVVHAHASAVSVGIGK